MSNEVNPPRRYESYLRQQQSRETRQHILDAARRLFLSRGYVATTIAAIGQEAGVATQTVYVSFGNKRSILTSLMDLSIGGDEQPVGVLQRSAPQQMRHTLDQRRQLEMMAHGIREIMERASPIFDVMRSAGAADPEVATIYQRLQEQRLKNMAHVVEWVAANGPLRQGLTVRAGADILWTLTSADVHRLLTVDRGWTGEQYEHWLGDTLIALLLPPASA